MRIIFIVVIVILACVKLEAQQWIDPVVISSTDGYNMSPDIIVDSDGIIHVVWSYKVDDNYWKIFYSYSNDDGSTWSVAYDLLQNTHLWMSQPHIACDSENNLFVTYDYNTGNPSQLMVYLITKVDGQWNEPELISENMLGSSYNQVMVDDDDRLYVFWSNNSRSYYKYYEDSIWSEIFAPYEQKNLLTSFSIDTLSNLHCGGGNWTSSPDKIKLAYYKYNKAENFWSSPEIITSNFIEVDQDISIDNLGNPHLTWREREQVPIPQNDYTFYIYFDGISWTEKEMVVEDPWEQQIAIDQNNEVHIVDREKLPVGWQLVHHRKLDNQWVGCLVDSSEVVIARPEIIYNLDKLYLVYDKTWEVLNNEFESDIFITSFDLQTGIKSSNEHPQIKFSLYPNPASEVVHIDFSVEESCLVNLYIFSLNGGLIIQLENSRLNAGNYHYQWDGRKNDGSKLERGLYLCRLQQGRTIVTRSIQIVD